MTPRFRHLTRQGPRWLFSGDGGGVLYALGLTLDAFAERLRLGLRSHFPLFAPPDALAKLGADHGLLRGTSESDESFAQRLTQAVPNWKGAGNAYSLMRQLRAMLGADPPLLMRVVNEAGSWFTLNVDDTIDWTLDLSNWDWDDEDFADVWARFWVIIYAGDFWETDGEWGDPGDWGDGGTWGSTATLEQVADVKRQVHAWKPAGSWHQNTIVSFDDDAWPAADDTTTDGTQYQWHELDGSDGAVPTRPEHPIFWGGDH